MIFSSTLNSKSLNRALTIESEFNSIHSFKYDYSKSLYSGYKLPFVVHCPDHGDFTLTPKHHFEGAGCPICNQIRNNGHISITSKNLKEHKDLLLSYLHEQYKNFDFSNLRIDNGFYFDCKIHGAVHSKFKIVCRECVNDEKRNKLKSVFKKYIKNRTEEVIEINEKDIVLKCEHQSIRYTKKQIQMNVHLCSECKGPSKNKITQEEFIKRAIARFGNIYDIKNTIYVDALTKIPLVCEKHGAFKMTPSNFFKGQGCPKCTHRVSKAEEEILKLIPGAKQSDRSLIKPYELDILTDTFAIEFDGLMYHSEGNGSNKFLKRLNGSSHLNKTELVESKNLQLFHIFENEWINSKDKWKSIINNKLNFSNRLYARNCSIKEINNEIYKDFCITNHLQGYGIASIRLGLYHKDELVQIMSFAKSRYDKSIQYELIRMCSKLNTTVIGGASKLLKHFERNYKPDSIISYANRRWSQGNVYVKLGFDFIENTPPNYFYFKPNENILYSREKFQKHKLKNILTNFDIQLSESENMFNAGYRKIYDCGNKKFVKRYK